jgi:hypothetical protein
MQCLLLRLPRTRHVENAVQSPSEMNEGPRWLQPPQLLPPAREGVPAGAGGGMVALCERDSGVASKMVDRPAQANLARS